jgi:hypothetical protein
MANYLKKKVQCMDCSKSYFEMVLNGAVDKFNFRCSSCDPDGINSFGRK